MCINWEIVALSIGLNGFYIDYYDVSALIFSDELRHVCAADWSNSRDTAEVMLAYGVHISGGF